MLINFKNSFYKRFLSETAFTKVEGKDNNFVVVGIITGKTSGEKHYLTADENRNPILVYGGDIYIVDGSENGFEPRLEHPSDKEIIYGYMELVNNPGHFHGLASGNTEALKIFRENYDKACMGYSNFTKNKY